MCEPPPSPGILTELQRGPPIMLNTVEKLSIASLRSLRLFGVFLLVLLGWGTWSWSQEAAVATPAQAAETPPASGEEATGSEYIRIRRDSDDNPTAMETAVVRFATEDGRHTVDLVAAVHVADKPYYDELNRRFQEYDAVLYELVAPAGTRVPRGGAPRTSGVSLLQGGMTDVLNLSFQLDCVDYQQPNMVHADLSPEEFSASMKARGESGVKLFFRMMGHSMAQQSNSKAKNSDAAVLAALFSKDRDHRLKQIMAEQFEDMEGALNAINGPDGSTLVTVRNAKALSVMKKEMDQGKKKLAIFYGAAHLPDMEQHLVKDFSMQQKNQTWLQAWDLSESAK
ncbi:MAG: hypothetical protein KDA60_03455 [Planctomycetales bacterium]|nr:hypothetical protein [Planctomycetales bacterium]